MRVDDFSKEVQGITIRKREMKDQVEMTIDDFSKEVAEKTKFVHRQCLLFQAYSQIKRFCHELCEI
jgi:hypothetical protein